MKKTYLIITVLVATLFVSCDPFYTCDNKVSNNSGHRVKVVPLNYSVYTNSRDTNRRDTVYMSSIAEIENGQEVTVASSGDIGYASREECIYVMRHYLGDSVDFLFDDGKHVLFRSTDTTGISPYNFNGACYSYVQDLNVHRGKATQPYYGVLTLKVGEDFYQLAQ